MIKNICTLLFLYFWVKIQNLFEWMKVVCLYYKKPAFALSDLVLMLAYLFINPYRISKNYLKRMERENIYTYGETPLTGFAKIMSTAKVNSEDVVFELGCGRGGSCLWLHDVVGCRVVGVEEIPVFIKIARWISKFLKKQRIEWRQEDILNTDFTGASIIYFYGTGFEGAFLDRFLPKLESLPKGVKCITVSYPIREYNTSTAYDVQESLKVRFPWGEAQVFIQVKR